MSGIMTAYITTSSTTVGREYLFLSLSFFFFFLFGFLLFYICKSTVLSLHTAKTIRRFNGKITGNQLQSICRCFKDARKYSQESSSTAGSKKQVFWVIMSFNPVKKRIFKFSVNTSLPYRDF